MRGFPPIQLLLVIIGFSLLSIPLYRLTEGRIPDSQPVEKQVPAPEISNGQIKASLQIRCAHFPQKLELFTSKGSLIVWENEKNWPQTTSLTLDGSAPLEIGITATWDKTIPSTAVTVEFTPENRPTETQTLWSVDSEMEDVFLFNNKPDVKP